MADYTDTSHTDTSWPTDSPWPPPLGKPGIQTTVKLPAEVSVRLAEAAKERGLGLSNLAVRLVSEGLDNLTPVSGKLTRGGGG